MNHHAGRGKSGVRVVHDRWVARVVLARPEVRNALDETSIDALRAAFQELAEEPAHRLRAVVLSGEGAVFCAGADISRMRDAVRLGEEANLRNAREMRAMYDAIDVCPVPVIARVHGAALGGAMGLCAVSDVVVATRDAVFGFTETKLGIFPAVIAPLILRRIGEGHARALFPTGERFDAARAQAIGLVHEVLDGPAEVDLRIEAILEEIATAGPTAIRGAKSIVRDLRSLSSDDARDIGIRRIAEQRASPEGQEGLAAFLERRRSDWVDSS